MSELAEYWNYIDGAETPEQYSCFASYRDMGARRTIRAVALLHERSDSLLHRWAGAGSWVDRAKTYDLEQLKVRDALVAERRNAANNAWADRRAELLEAVEDITMQGLEKLAHNMRTNRSQLRASELRGFIETLTKWQNLANGHATEKLDFGVDYSKLTDDEMNKLDEASRLQELAKINT